MVGYVNTTYVVDDTSMGLIEKDATIVSILFLVVFSLLGYLYNPTFYTAMLVPTIMVAVAYPKLFRNWDSLKWE